MASDKEADLKANDEFEAAMKKWIEHYYGAEDGLIMDYVVICEQQTFDDDGDAAFSLKWKARRGQPSHRSLGIIDAMAARIRARIGATQSQRRP